MFSLFLEIAALSWVGSGPQLEFGSANSDDCVASHKLLRDGSEIFTFPTLDQFEYVDSDSLSPGSSHQYQLRVVSVTGSNVDSSVLTVCAGDSNCKKPHVRKKLAVHCGM